MNDSYLSDDDKISIGVSSCLLGDKVRYDGGHKRNDYLNNLMGDFFEYVSFCPEVAIGMGVPRNPIRLVDAQGEIRVVDIQNPQKDYTAPLREYAHSVRASIDNLCGYVFKKDSPSCGMERVKVYAATGMPERKGRGIYADEIIKLNPLLPCEDEGRLNDAVLRENFVNRVYVYARWKKMVSRGISKSSLLAFHTRHKYLLLAHNQQVYRELGRLLSSLNKINLEELAAQYITHIMHILGQRASRKEHVNVLQHLLGFLRDKLDASDRAELLEAITAYGRGEYPLVVPITLMQHHFRRNPHPFVDSQVYLYPHPRELMLRNSI